MSAAQPGHVTLILARIREGQDAAVHELLPLVYDELRALARRQVRRRAGTPTLQPTVLVHEAYLRLVGAGPAWESRAHFFAVAKTRRRVKRLIREAIQLHVEDLRERGDCIPKPTAVSELVEVPPA